MKSKESKMNASDRAPHSKYFITECIKAGKYQEAQNACDQNDLFYQDKAAEMRRLFIDAEKAKRGYNLGDIVLKEGPKESLDSAVKNG
mgnify:CR=1 FL=1